MIYGNLKQKLTFNYAKIDMPLYTKWNLCHFILQLWLRTNEVKNTVRENLKTVSPNPKYNGFKKV